jgi:hypothetical protein
MKRSGCCRSLFRGESFSDAEPCERELDCGHRCAKPVGGIAFCPEGRVVGGCGSVCGLGAGRGLGDGCCGHDFSVGVRGL